MLPCASLAVAVIKPSAATGSVTLKLALPPASVVTDVEPKNSWPSPEPSESQEMFEKKSMLKVATGALLSVP